MDPIYVSNAARQLAKELLWRLTYRHRSDPDKADICVYSSRRGGSTMLMEILGANRGMSFSDQPFGLFTASRPNINRLPIFPYGQIYAPDEQEQALLKDYVDGLFAGEIPANVPWKFWSGRGFGRTDRMTLKITDAKGLAGWFDSNYPVHTVVMTRHPIAQALSVQRIGWQITGKGFLRNDAYRRDHLTPELVEMCERVYAAGPSLACHVLDWGLENLPLIKGLRRNPHWVHVSYEGLVADSAAVVSMLARRLDLPDEARMLEVAGRPSRSTKRSSTAATVKNIRSGDVDHLLLGWRRKADEAELAGCFELLERLGVRLYGADSAYPDLSEIGQQEDERKVANG